MRIVSVSPGPVALVLSIVYAAFEIGSFAIFTFTDAPSLTLPIGFVAALIDFRINLHLPRRSSFGFIVLYAMAAPLIYALTGAITGGVDTLLFNFIAKQLDGIPAKFIETIDEGKLERYERSAASIGRRKWAPLLFYKRPKNQWVI
jgi:hypothetical protein